MDLERGPTSSVGRRGANGAEGSPWRRVDWIDAIGEAIITLIGPLAAPLKFLLKVREDLSDQPERTQINQQIAVVLEGKAGTEALRRKLARAVPHAEPQALSLYEFIVGQLSDAVAASQGSVAKVDEQLVAQLRGLADVVASDPKPLRHALSEYFHTQRQIIDLLSDARIPPGEVDLNDSAELVWGSVLRRLRGHSPIYLLLLLAEAHDRYGAVAEFTARYWIGGSEPGAEST
jgi:hypothetical protein